MDDGERVERAAAVGKLWYGRVDAELLAKGLDVWVLDPDGFVGDAFDVEGVPETIMSKDPVRI